MSEESAFITQGSVSAAAIAFLQAAVLRMIPYATPALILIILDLVYGCKAASYRKERVRFSTALRRTLTKTFCYVCWIVLASTLALSFEKDWLEWVVLGFVYLNEFSSIVGNYYEPKGIVVNWKKVINAVLKRIGIKLNTDLSDVNVEDFIESTGKKRSAKKPAKKEGDK